MNTKNNNARAVISQHTLVSPQVADAKADLLREVVESVIDEMIVVAGRQDEIFEEWTSENRAIIDGWQCRIADAISAAPPAADRATAPASDIGILLSALRNHEDATGEDFDDAGGVIAQIERDYLAGIVTSHEVVPVDRAAVIEECAKVCGRWIQSKNLHESLAATDIARDIRALSDAKGDGK